MADTPYQIHHFLDKIAEKFPEVEEPVNYTDIHIHVSQESGDLMAFDDDDKEITRCVIEEWMKNTNSPETFYNNVVTTLRTAIDSRKRNLGVVKPYSYVLENEYGEHIAELSVIDEVETIILGTPFMKDVDKELDDFITNLLKD